jgi:alkylation response protein AidB-like acyl-CoA dehydrogenase
MQFCTRLSLVELSLVLSYSPAQEAFRKEVRAFHSRAWPPADHANPEGKVTFRDLATAQGYLYRNIPRAYGGSERPIDLLRAEIIAEEFGKASAPPELRSRGLRLLVPTLLERGEDWRKPRFVPGTLTGEYVWCQAYSEPIAERVLGLPPDERTSTSAETHG